MKDVYVLLSSSLLGAYLCRRWGFKYEAGAYYHWVDVGPVMLRIRKKDEE